MNFADQMHELKLQVEKYKGLVQTEEATKHSMIIPFIKILGYDTSNPEEVIPEFVADWGTHTKSKVDYALVRDGKLCILIECKKSKGTLGTSEIKQLYYYFTATEARVGVLTNGIKYQFFTDIDKQNIMDEKPFFEFNISSYDNEDLNIVMMFCKNTFDVNKITSKAKDLKYKMYKMSFYNIIKSIFDKPTEDFVKLVYEQAIGEKIFTTLLFDQFAPITKSVLDDIIAEKAKKTEIRIAAAYFIRYVLRDLVDNNRVTLKDLKNYSDICLDNNSSKNICRFWFGKQSKLWIGFFEDKKIIYYPITSVYEIFNFENQVREKIKKYL